MGGQWHQNKMYLKALLEHTRGAEVVRLSANAKNVFNFSLGAYLLIRDNKHCFHPSPNFLANAVRAASAILQKHTNSSIYQFTNLKKKLQPHILYHTGFIDIVSLCKQCAATPSGTMG